MLALSPETQAALDAGRIVVRVGIVFDFGTQYAFWGGEGPFTWSSITFQPGGSLLEISDIPSVGDMTAESVTVTLRALPDAGLTPDVLATIESEDYHQAPATIYQLLFDPDTRALLTGIRHYAGYVDQIAHVDEGHSYALQATLESRARDHTKTGYRMRTTADQALVSPGDLFFQHVSTVATITRKWGRK